jgi:hypothetical protein
MDTLKRFTRINDILVVLALLGCSQGWADGGVLQSSSNAQNKSAQKSQLVSSDSQAASQSSVQPEYSGPTQTITLKFVPKNPPPVRPSVSEAPKLPPSYETQDETGIFKKESPHAVKPESISPFIKQVSADVPSPYINQKARVFSPGKPAGVSQGNVIEIRPKQAASSNQ